MLVSIVSYWGVRSGEADGKVIEMKPIPFAKSSVLGSVESQGNRDSFNDLESKR